MNEAISAAYRYQHAQLDLAMLDCMSPFNADAYKQCLQLAWRSSAVENVSLMCEAFDPWQFNVQYSTPDVLEDVQPVGSDIELRRVAVPNAESAVAA